MIRLLLKRLRAKTASTLTMLIQACWQIWNLLVISSRTSQHGWRASAKTIAYKPLNHAKIFTPKRCSTSSVSSSFHSPWSVNLQLRVPRVFPGQQCVSYTWPRQPYIRSSGPGSSLNVITSKSKEPWQQQAGKQAGALHENHEVFLVFLFCNVLEGELRIAQKLVSFFLWEEWPEA